MRRPLAAALLLAAGCGPHASGRFFAPRTPGTLVPTYSTARCGTFYGLPVDAYQPEASVDSWSTGSDPWANCPERPWMEEIVREEAQRVPLTLAEVGTFRLVIAPPELWWTRDGRRLRWATDGYTVEAHLWSVRPALAEAFNRGPLLREGHR